jgi:hypothetical protein
MKRIAQTGRSGLQSDKKRVCARGQTGERDPEMKPATGESSKNCQIITPELVGLK